MRIGLAQINPIVGNLAANAAKIRDYAARAREQGCDLVVFPELAITGYPPRDLLDRPAFVEGAEAVLQDLVRDIRGVAAIIGGLEKNGEGRGKPLYNAAFLLDGKGGLASWFKHLLPSYDVFDETRYFEPGTSSQCLRLGDIRLGVTVCEDIWNQACQWGRPLYCQDPVEALVEDGAEILINISSSPYSLGKEGTRQQLVSKVARRSGVPVIYVNQVGANDDLIFDGQSLAVDSRGNVWVRAASFQEDLVVLDLEEEAKAEGPPPVTGVREEMLYQALALGVRDYTRKCGFTDVVLGLSGGIDSSVTACIAAEALGPKHVHGIAMPSQYSSEGSLVDARQLADNLGLDFRVIPIQVPFNALREALAPSFAGLDEDITEENIQARLRGLILMAHSNKFGWLLLNTGNKSELAVGYCTLYGDMCGGLAVISDVLKTDVYRLARWINREREIIPVSTLTKPPSAELRPDQKDEDSLPPYEVMDEILRLYIEEGMAGRDIIAAGFDAETVRYVLRLVDRSEYKRRQAPPGLRVSAKAFGTGWRMPIAQQYRG